MFRHFYGPYPGFSAPWWWLAHLLGGVLGLLFWVALIGLVVWAVTRLARGRPLVATPPPMSTVDVVRQRYARGEIDETTYMQMMERLSASELQFHDAAQSARPEGPPPPEYTGGSPGVRTRLV